MLWEFCPLNAALQSHVVLRAAAILQTQMDSFLLKNTYVDCKQIVLNPTSPASFFDLQSHSASSNLLIQY